jgi:3-dehydroquinate synthase
MTEILHVELEERSYPIYIGTDLWEIFGEVIAKLRHDGRRVVVIADKAVAQPQPELMKRITGGDDATLLLEGGEATKSLRHLEKAYNWMTGLGLDRRSVVFAVGGGVIGDLAGFVAATYLRGLDFYQVPTTLLAMVDSSVGGKTGINLKAGKNLAGAFWQPRAVLVDTLFLSTLPAREFACGMGEVIKYGLLGDAKLFRQLERSPALHWKHPELPSLIHDCCEIKAGIVMQDERETKASGGRALLNLGHTFGHAVEKVSGYAGGQKKGYGHGEAVGLGLVLAARLSHRLGWLAEKDVARVERLVAANGLPVRLKAPLKLTALLAAMKLDKKTVGGRLRFVALRAIGKAETVDGVSEEWIREIWRGAGAV